MTALALGVTYVAVGLLVAGVSLRSRRERWPNAALTFVLWPFALLAMFPDGVQDERLGNLEQQLRRWSDAQKRRAVERFINRLHEERKRVAEIERELVKVHPTGREPLSRMRDESREEFERGVALLEELSGQLTVLRFAGRSPDRLDRERVEHLLLQVEAMLAATATDDEQTQRQP